MTTPTPPLAPVAPIPPSNQLTPSNPVATPITAANNQLTPGDRLTPSTVASPLITDPTTAPDSFVSQVQPAPVNNPLPGNTSNSPSTNSSPILDFLVGAKSQNIQQTDISKVLENVPPQDFTYEALAGTNGLVYKDNLSTQDIDALRNAGYQLVPGPNGETIWQGKDDMQLLVLNRPDGDKGVVVFRGSNAVDFPITNFNPNGIGTNQFDSNKDLINQALKASAGRDGKSDVTGHSLGGALALLTTANFSDQVDRTVTFQTPGTNSQTAAKLYPIRDRITNYTVNGDPVTSTGEGLPGKTVVFQDPRFSLTAPLDAHMMLPLSSAKAALGQQPPGSLSQYMRTQPGYSSQIIPNLRREAWTMEGREKPGQTSFIEDVRKFIGRLF